MNIKKALLLLSLLLGSVSVFADDGIMIPPTNNPVCMGKTCPYTIKQGKYLTNITCTSTDSSGNYTCNLQASDGGSVTVNQDLANNLDSHLTYSWPTPTLLEIDDNYQQGSNAYFNKRTIFIDFQNLEISSVFFSVYATNLNQMVVLAESAADQDQTPDPSIYIIPMFNPTKTILIARDFSGFYVHDVYPEPMSHFLNNGNLQLVYRNSQHKIITEVIPVNYSKLGIKQP